jgi:hypothetical protein
MADGTDWLEVAKLGVAALTPLVTGLVGVFVLRMGTRIEATKHLHQQLLSKRLDLFEDIAPKLNDIHCFFQAIGHWAELDPQEVIRRKRAIDRTIQVNRYLFSGGFWDAYQRFERAHFEMFSTPGQPARLRLDLQHMRERLGEGFKNEWLPSAASSGGDHREQRDRYQELMQTLGHEVRGMLA